MGVPLSRTSERILAQMSRPCALLEKSEEGLSDAPVARA
jgi:hypothetical protein